ncbi:MAG: peptidyl-prolyl cis-trans isomerase [Capsulimonas sp.]|uniref:peptidyl-prolyl cis-trans isomerase n=1 Tax=Capsulimonas sp. TaxID=2494211 RepID=UPI003265AC55
MKTLKANAAALLILTALLPTMTRAQETTEPFVTIGAEKISRSDYIQALEAQSGKTVLQKLVFASLIRQAAAKDGVTPTDAEVDKRMAALMRRNPNVIPDALLAPEQRKQFVENLKLDLALENLRLRNITVTDAEVDQYYAAHAADYQLPQQVKTTIVVTESVADSKVAEGLLGKNTSEEDIAQKPGFHVVGVNGFSLNMDALALADKNRISSLVFSAKPQEVKSLKVQTHYLTFRINKQDVKRTPPLAQVRSEVVRAAKLAKAPDAVAMLRTLYLWTPPTFQDQKYERQFDDINPGAARSNR